MLSTAKSANVGFSQGVQLFAPPTNPATTENSIHSLFAPRPICSPERIDQ